MPRKTQSWWNEVGSELCSQVLSHAFDAVIVSDEGGRIVEFNPAAERLFVVERSEILGRELADTIVPERHRENHRAALRRWASRHPDDPLARRMETTARRHDGTEFPVDISLTSLPVDPPIFIAFLRELSPRV
jgi:PAS domain S-box-containing protein